MTEMQTRIEKDKVARSFLRGLDTYDGEAVVQQCVNHRLLELLSRLNRSDFRRILEIGCCTGMLTRLLVERFSPEIYYLNDLVPEFCSPVLDRLETEARSRIEPYFGDIEESRLPDDLDLVVSSSTLQWLVDLNSFFARVEGALSKTGILAFSMFGAETLYELTELTGAGLDYLPFPKVRDMLAEKFRIIYSAVDRQRIYFSQPSDVLRHIQATGVSGVGGFTWTPRRLQKFYDDYRQRYTEDEGVGLTYVSYDFICTKGLK